MSREALKPCPMCGGEAKDEPTHGVVACLDCGISGPGWNDPGSRADAWNQRAQVPADRDAVRWRWYMSDAPKDLNGFMQGVREHWTMDQWNAWVDAEMLAAAPKEPKP